MAAKLATRRRKDDRHNRRPDPGRGDSCYPQGLWLVLTLVLLQFIIEMAVTRNYALAVVFITAAALTIASGGHPVPDVGHLLWVRGVDTFLGCVSGLVILAMTCRCR